MAVRAVLFDFDGLILDTETPELRAWTELFAAHGQRLDLATWQHAIGTAEGLDPYRLLEARTGATVDRAALRATVRARVAELLEGVGPLPGVRRWLGDAEAAGLRVGLVSSSTHAWVDGHLRRLGLAGCFPLRRCRDDVRVTKPAPDLYLAGLRALGVAADEAIAVEDSPNGVRAAKAAGLWCVAVPNTLTRQLRLDHADLVVSSLAALPLRDAVVAADRRT